MKKTRFLTGTLASVMAFTLFSANVFAADVSSGDGTIDGDSTVNDVTFKVTVPANIDFAIDPFVLGTDIGGGQLTGTSYDFLNKTEAPVKVWLDFEAILTGGSADAQLVSDPSELSMDDDSVTDKKLYFAVLGAKSITVASDAITASTFDKAEEGTFIPFAADSKKASTGFVLAASTDGTAVLQPGVGAFTFYGMLNTYADWQAGDIKVSADYTLTALRPATYTTLSDAAKGVNQISGTETAPAQPGFPGLSSNSFTVSKAAITDLRIPFNAAGGTVKITTNPGVEFASGEYTVDANSVTIKAAKLTTLYGGSTVGAKSLKIVVTGGTAPDTYVLNVNLTN